MRSENVRPTDRPTDETRDDDAREPIRTPRPASDAPGPPDDDGRDDEDGGGGERRPLQAMRRAPQPLLRTTLTVANPADTDYGDPAPATIDVIVLTERSHDDDVTASEADLPELSQAGWHRFKTGILEIHIRVVS